MFAMRTGIIQAIQFANALATQWDLTIWNKQGVDIDYDSSQW